MKKTLIVILALLVCIPNVMARKKSPKAGTIDNGVYIDSEYDFQFKVPENWKPEYQKPGKNMRLVLNQKNHEIPPELMPFPTMAQVPELEIYHAKTPLSPAVYVDSLVSESYSSDEKKEILKHRYALEQGVDYTGIKPSGREKFKVGELEAYRWHGTMEFSKKLGMGETIPRSYGLVLWTVKKGDEIVVFSLYCEVTFQAKLIKEVTTMVESLQWIEPSEG